MIFDRLKVFHYGNIGAGDETSAGSKPTKILANFVFSADCVLCGKKRDLTRIRRQAAPGSRASAGGLCETCEQLDQQSIAKLLAKLMRSEKSFVNLMRTCQMCTQNDKLNLSLGRTDCASLDCPNTFLCMEARHELKKTNYIRKVIDQFF